MFGWAIAATAFAAAVSCAAYARERALGLRVRLLEARECERIETIAALADAARVSPEAVLDRLDGALRNADPGLDAVLVYVPAGEELVCAHARGARVEAFAAGRLRGDGDALPARAARAMHRLREARGVAPTDRDALAVPVLDGDAPLFVLCASARRALADAEALTLAALRAAPAYALAVERARDVRRATYDGLTGLLTAQAFRARLRETLDGGSSAHVSLWFVDTDEFKAVNDRLGHGAGDAVLAQMAELLRAHAGTGDAVGRNGGDEFCALLFGAPKSRAIERAEGFRRAVRSHDFGIGRALSASVGVAAFPLDAATPNALLERADAAMYHSKRMGRDRVSFALGPDSFAVYAS